MEQVRQLHPSQQPNPVTTFFAKSPNDMTVGDALLMHTGTVLISALVPMVLMGGIELIKRKS